MRSCRSSASSGRPGRPAGTALITGITTDHSAGSSSASSWVAELDGIEAFERLEVLYWLHQSRRDLVRQSPGNNGVTRGTFAIRSPLRPNPIGTSIVALVGREGSVLNVRGLDCVDGTPLLDLKPDRSSSLAAAPVGRLRDLPDNP